MSCSQGRGRTIRRRIGHRRDRIADRPVPQGLARVAHHFDYNPVINIENHDTIGILALDNEGRLAGGHHKWFGLQMHGRVGDNPILGAGLFVDPEVGGAATGLGEAVMKTVGSFLVVELMRNGRSAQDACEEAVHRIMDRMPTDDLQVGYLALGRDGGIGGHAIHGGFNYVHTTSRAES